MSVLHRPEVVDIGVKGIYYVIYGIISEFTDKGQFQYLTKLNGPQEGTYLSFTKIEINILPENT